MRKELGSYTDSGTELTATPRPIQATSYRFSLNNPPREFKRGSGLTGSSHGLRSPVMEEVHPVARETPPFRAGSLTLTGTQRFLDPPFIDIDYVEPIHPRQIETGGHFGIALPS